MRNEMVDAFMKLAGENSDFVVLTADLGFSVFEDFEDQFPNQYFNVGVCEQNMVGLASGMAAEGCTVFCYSIGNFSFMRNLEQIRNDASYHELNVNIIGMGGGYNYGPLGVTHHATEDLSIMQSIPGLDVIAPATGQDAFDSICQIARQHKPSYFRLEKIISPTSLNLSQFQSGKLRTIKEGNDGFILAIGAILSEVAEAVEILAEQGHNFGYGSITTIKPLDKLGILEIASHYDRLIVVEENNLVGGVSSEIATLLMRNCVKLEFLPIGIDDTLQAIVGDQQYLRHVSGISAQAISERVLVEWS